jgi:site-specific DNA-methyltransferase (adenine-specific)
MISNAFNMDCMEAMKKFPDKYFELAIVDPPYGIKAGNVYTEKSKVHGKSNALRSAYKVNWDNSTPDEDYFNELFRVSKNQIIWGGNYFNLPPTKGYIVWEKFEVKLDFSPLELAWTSNMRMGIFKFLWSGYWQGDMKNKEKRIHPTQKPVALYKWLLSNYAKQGDKIVDTHLGSGSSRIAAWDMGFDFWGYELDSEYFEAQEKRFNNFKMQGKLFI